MVLDKLAFVFLNYFGLLATYFVTVGFARLLTVQEFGMLSYYKAIMTLVLMVTSFGLDRSGIYYIKCGGSAGSILSFRLIVFSLISLFVGLFCFAYDSSNAIVFVFILAAGLVSTFDIKYIYDIKNRVKVDIFLSLFKSLPLLIYLGYAYFFKPTTRGLDYFIYFLLGSCAYVSLQHLNKREMPIPIAEPKEMKKILSISYAVALGILLSFLNNYSDIYIIKNYLGPTQVGFYSAAYTIYAGMIVGIGVFLRFFISENISQGFENNHKLGEFKLKMLFIGVTGVALIAIFGDEIIKNVYSEKYIDSYSVLIFLLPSFLFVSIGSIYGHVLIVSGKTTQYMISMALAFCVNLYLNIKFIPINGIEAASISTSISSLVAVLMSYFFYSNSKRVGIYE